MTLTTIIRDRTNDGADVIDFLVAVMRDELAGFKPCHRLDAAKLLARYDCTCRKPAVEGKSALAERHEALNFTLDYTPDPSRPRSGSGSSGHTEFEQALARVIRKSTDDGRSVCRFLINVMEGELKAFKPHHRIAAARELLSRGFGKHARGISTHHTTRTPSPLTGEGWGEGEKTEGRSTSSHPSTPTTQPTESEKSPNQINQSSDDGGLAAFMEKVTPLLDEDDRIKAELAEKDPENQPYKRDLSAYHQAWDNSEKWFYEWKNSLDPEEYEAIAAREIAEFNAMIDTKIERRKQIKADRERREKEEVERLAQQKEAELEATAEESEEPGPPTRSQHKQKLMFTLGNSMYVDCGHPDCHLHDEDRNRWQGSVQYGAGPTSGHFP